MTKSHTAGWASDSPTPAQIKEFFSQIDSGRITKTRFQDFLRNGKRSGNEDVARSFLGPDYISPEEALEALGICYLPTQLQHLSETLPNSEVLQYLKDNNFAFLPGPPQSLGLLHVRDLNPTLFHSKTGGWYQNQKFSTDDKVSCEWLAIRKEPVPKSINKNWKTQLKLIPDKEHVPNAAEMFWFLTTFYKVRKTYLFPRIYVRTSSVGSGGNRVVVGYFDSDGLVVYSGWGGSCGSNLGVASARKL